MIYSIIKSYIRVQTHEQYSAIENKLKFSSIRFKLIFYLSRRDMYNLDRKLPFILLFGAASAEFFFVSKRNLLIQTVTNLINPTR